MQEFLIQQEVYFEECEAIGSGIAEGRGGGLYINFEQNSPYEFRIGTDTHFINNEAIVVGRDIFIYCESIDDLDPDLRLLFDVFSDSYNQTNALYGTEFTQPDPEIDQKIDYNLLLLIQPYFNDKIYISSDQTIAADSVKCGRIKLPCQTLRFGLTKVLTPEWTADSIPQYTQQLQITYIFVVFQEIYLYEPFQTEVDNIILRGALETEFPAASNYAQMKIRDQGQIICSDLAKWQLQEQDIEIKGVNQYLTIQNIEFIIPRQTQLKSIIALIGKHDNIKNRRNVELTIKDCIIIQELHYIDVSCGFLKSEQFTTGFIHITLENVDVQDLQLNQTALIDLIYEPNFVSLQNNCIISNQTSPSSSSNLAPSNSDTFLPLWLSQKEIGQDGSGLIVAYGRSIPTIKADGIQFIDGAYITINGQGENESSIIQKDASHNLFILNGSQLVSSDLTTEILGGQSALVRSEGKGMSIINGLRVTGRNLEGTFVQGSIFEIISGELSLIDIQIKDVNIIENNQERISENKRRMKIKGLIEMKKDGQLLYIEKFIIKNINIEQTENNNKWSSIIMNAGHLKLRDGTFLGEAYTSIGSAIRAYPTGPSTINVEGVLFKGQGDGQGTNGGAVYVDMRQFDVQMSFKRCIFIGNNAEYGSNIFIQYASPSQLIKINSFSGCTAIVKNSYESDISVCFSIGNINEAFIDERNLLHTSWNRQQNEGVVRFISNTDADHSFDSSIKCGSPSYPCDKLTSLFQYLKSEPESIDGSTGRAETIMYAEGYFALSFIDLIHTRSSIVNIAGCQQNETIISAQPNHQNVMIQGDLNQNIVIERLCLALSPSSPLVGLIRTQGAEAGLVLQDMRVQGYLETNPQNTMLEPPYLFSIEGFAQLNDVIFEHVYLRTGSILNIIGLRRIADDNRMEWLAKTSIGFYSCIFDDITSNETALITLHEKDLENNSDLSQKNLFNRDLVDNSLKTTKFIISDTIFSDCSTSLHLNGLDSKGGLMNIINKKVRVEILNSEFHDISIKARNMIYFGWGVKESDGKEIKLLTITETLFINCTAVIPGMKAKIEALQIGENNSNYQTVNEKKSGYSKNELYTDDEEIFDSLYQHGLLFINNQNKKNDDLVSLGRIDITGLFVWNCHSAVGSLMTVTRLKLDISESNAEDPLCFGNILYLNQTQATIIDCQFKGYNQTYTSLKAETSVVDQEKEEIFDQLCPSNPNLFSFAQLGLVYIYKGKLQAENDQFDDTRIGAMKLEDVEVELKNISFNDPIDSGEESDGSNIMVTCTGNSKLNIIEPSVNSVTEEYCENRNYQSLYKSGMLLNEIENECVFGSSTDSFISPAQPSTNDEELPRDGRGYIIWPPDNATKLPITTTATVLNNHKATFSMSDYSWCDSRKKWYGILASKDGKHFMGVDGKEDEPVRLQVEVEEGEQFINYLMFKLSSWQAWLIPPTVRTGINKEEIRIKENTKKKRVNQSQKRDLEAQRTTEAAEYSTH
ncbi:MAG: hypothetical protein EZS28_011043 [Streblomastix strix]|uniref:Uncharacterized protein n=1 Tax=Streblomastix strix TaxID=222440 RepID=A0A5J4WEN6_9EUKA|nr:MAG: hypothetical protein EZS28_011043 [Streblomastix strix]